MISVYSDAFGRSPDLLTSGLQTAYCLLFNGILERLGGAELRGTSRIDVNRLARARIAPLARGARLGREDAEPCDRNFFASLQSGHNRANHALNRAFGVCLRAPKHAVHLVYDICFVHEYLLIDNPRDQWGGAGMP